MFYGGFSAPHWCGGCGRKLGGDGRCGGCDAWWSSPLITVGGPLAGATLFFLAVTIGVFRANDPAPQQQRPRPAAAILAARRVESAGHAVPYLPSPGRLNPAFGPPRYTPVTITPRPPPPAVFTLSAPSEAEMQMERLRGLVSQADAVVAAQEAARLGLPAQPAGSAVSGVSRGPAATMSPLSAQANAAWF